MIRARTTALLAEYANRTLWVTKCNSGSARHQWGKPVPRGPSTFQHPDTAPFKVSEVIELSYRDEALLPDDTQWSTSLAGPWRSTRSAI